MRYVHNSMLILILSVVGFWPRLYAGDVPFTPNEQLGLLTEEDATMFESMVELALDSEPDGHVLSWENPVTTANGTLQITSTDEDGDRYCRDVALVRYARGHTEQWSLLYCRLADNTWVLDRPPSASKDAIAGSGDSIQN